MATAKEIRLENLKILIAEFKTAEAVAQRAATAPMYLSQILNGAKSATGKARGIGDALARRLEQGCGKEIGWLDKPPEEKAPGGLPTGVHYDIITTEERNLIAKYRAATGRGREIIMLAAERAEADLVAELPRYQFK